MRHLALALALAVSGCAVRGPVVAVPIVQDWTAILLDESGEGVVYAATVEAIYPFMTLVHCRPGLVLASSSPAGCRKRMFRFATLDQGRRTVTYREIQFQKPK